MAKLIFSENVIKETTDISPIVGHEIVVYKKNGGKFTLLEHLSENQTFQETKKTFLERLLRAETNGYVGYAVDMNKDLESTHSDVFQADDFNSFDLTYSIEYQVVDVIRLVSKVIEAGEDALGKLRIIAAKEIKETLLKALPVEYIADNDMFKEYARGIAEIHFQKNGSPDEHSRKIAGVYATINRKVADIGLQVNKINLSRRLSQQEIEEEKRKKEKKRIHEARLDEIKKGADLKKTARHFEEETGIARVEYEKEITRLKREQEIIEANYKLEREVIEASHAEDIERIRRTARIGSLTDAETLDNYQRNRQLKQAMVEAAEKALMNVGGNVNTATELRKAADEIRRLVFDQNPYANGENSLGAASGQNALPAAGGKLLLPKLNDKSLTELIKIFSQILEILNDSTVPGDKTKLIMSKILHLFGELILGDDADEAQVNLYAEQVRKQFSSVMHNLRLERPQQLRDLFDLEELKKRFR
jgi:hypothetical protein